MNATIRERRSILLVFLWLAQADGEIGDPEISVLENYANTLKIENFQPKIEINKLPRNLSSLLRQINSLEAQKYLLKGLINFCFCDGNYSAFERKALFVIAKQLGRSKDLIPKVERQYIEQSALKGEIAVTQPPVEQENEDFDWGKAALIGGIAVGGGLLTFLTAGAAAPAVGGMIGTQVLGLSGAAAVNAGLAAVGGGSLAAGGLGMAGGTAVITSVLGAGGAAVAGTKASKLFGNLREFDVIPLTSERKACHEILCIHGFMQDGIIKPKQEWQDVIQSDLYSGIYSLNWESKELLDWGNLLLSLSGKLAAAQAVGVAAKAGMKNAGGILIPPALAFSAFNIIDNPYFVARDRAEKAGVELAKRLASSPIPISLLGYSLGSRVIAYALQYLNENKHYGKVYNVYFLGGAVRNDFDIFRDGNINKVVANKVFNAYSRKDLVLAYLYRVVELGDEPIGLSPIEKYGVHDIDVTNIVGGHCQYAKKIGQILKRCS